MENKDFRKIINRMEQKLHLLDCTNFTFQERILSAINITATTYNEIREVVSKHGFNTSEEEIYFFKEIKPLVNGKLLLYLEIYFIETKRPVANVKLQLEYFRMAQKRILKFFDEYREFYSYYRSGSSLLDNHFFVRGQTDTFLTARNTRVLTYPEFNTSHDYILSKIKAFELVLEYIESEVNKLTEKDKETEKSNKAEIETGLYWTDPKIFLIELIYALHYSRAINGGKTNIIGLCRIFESTFNIELGDIYRAFTEIRFRVKERTKFLDLLREELLRRMDDADQK